MDYIAFPDIVEVSEAHTTLEALCNFLDVVFEALERFQLALVDGLSIPLYAHDGVALNLAVDDIRAADYEVLADLEKLAYFSRAYLHLLLERLNKTLNRLFQIIGYLIDDAVRADVDAGLLRHFRGVLIGLAVEADYDTVRGCGEVDVVFRDVAGGNPKDAHLHFLAGQPPYRIGDRFCGTLHVRLYDHIELFDLALLQQVVQGLETDPVASPVALDETPFALGGQLVTMSASFGAACADGDELLDAPALLARADRAMYDAKAAGRNCVSC